MIIQHITQHDDLLTICAELTHASWGDDNDMAQYKPEHLRTFLADKAHLLVVGYVDSRIACSALCYCLHHPDKQRRSLYIDELDTHPAYRRKGYASAMVTWLQAFAAEHELPEVWLTTEMEDNEAANSFYRAIKPDEELKCNLYSYKAK
jgi:ribosomal protein S18 acetylase RimI-like enzyme